VIAIEISDDRLGSAKSIGVDKIINPLKSMALQLVKARGRIVVVGLRFEPIEIIPSVIAFKEAEIIGSRVYIDEFSRVLKLMSIGISKS